jgi:Ca2+-binding RTX toxin-like protein
VTIFIVASTLATFVGASARQLGTTVTCNRLPATIVGTAGDDFIDRHPGEDAIAGLGGNDVIIGGRGHDDVCGNEGHDSLIGLRPSDGNERQAVMSLVFLPQHDDGDPAG